MMTKMFKMGQESFTLKLFIGNYAEKVQFQDEEAQYWEGKFGTSQWLWADTIWV